MSTGIYVGVYNVSFIGIKKKKKKAVGADLLRSGSRPHMGRVYRVGYTQPSITALKAVGI